MVKAALLSSASAALVGVPSVSTASAPPKHYRFEASFSFPHPYLSQQCGTQVIWSRTGTDPVTISRNNVGLVVRELDYPPASKITISAPSLGTSFTTVRSTLSTWDYGAGAQLGSTVTITAHGLFGDVPGHIAAEAGTTTLRDDRHWIHLRGRADGPPPRRCHRAPDRESDRPGRGGRRHLRGTGRLIRSRPRSAHDLAIADDDVRAG